MRAGRLRRRLTIESPTGAGDSQGGTVVSWAASAALTDVPGDIEPLMGREALEASKVQATLTHRIRIRRNDTTAVVTPKYRVREGSRIFHIHGVVNVDERDRELLLHCSEVQS